MAKRKTWILAWDDKDNLQKYNNEIENIYKILNDLEKRIEALEGSS